MNPVAIILIVGIIVMLALNALACYRVIASEELEPTQKALQCMLIWFIPVLGAGLCIALTREPKPAQVKGYSSSATTMDPLAVGVTSFGHGAGDYFID